MLGYTYNASGDVSRIEYGIGQRLDFGYTGRRADTVTYKEFQRLCMFSLW